MIRLQIVKSYSDKKDHVLGVLRISGNMQREDTDVTVRIEDTNAI